MYSPLSPCPLPRKGWHRVAVLGAWMPNSDYIYRNTLLSIASKMSQCEHGCVGKGPLERPKPGTVLGGPVMPFAKAQHKSNEELRTWIWANCGDLDLPPVPGHKQAVVKKSD